MNEACHQKVGLVSIFEVPVEGALAQIANVVVAKVKANPEVCARAASQSLVADAMARYTWENRIDCVTLEIIIRASLAIYEQIVTRVKEVCDGCTE